MDPRGRSLFALVSIILLLVLMFVSYMLPGPPTGEAGGVHFDPPDSFFLDVGSEGDNDTSSPIYLVESSGLSGRLTGEGRTYRELNENNNFEFFVNTSTLDLAANGVPYRDAIIEITFKDVVNETDCTTVQSTRAYCRPRIGIDMEYAGIGDWTLEGFGGIEDGLWKITPVFIESTPWQTLQSQNGLFQFRITYPDQVGSGAPLPLDSIELRFFDENDFDVLRELDREARLLIRADYIENNTIDAGQYSKNYVIYARNYLEKIYPVTVPSASEITDTLETFEVAGNEEPLIFAVYAFEDLHNVSAEISDLVMGTEIIPSESVRIDRVVYLDKRWSTGYSTYYGVNPWYLDTAPVAEIPANTSQQFWLTVTVPEGMQPGVYEGVITVAGSDMEPSEISVSLEVFAIELEEPEAPSYVYHSPYIPSKHYSDPRDVAVDDMAAHDTMPMTYFMPGVTCNNPDCSNYTIDFKEHPDELLSFQQRGILSPTIPVIILYDWQALWRYTQGHSNYLIGDSTLFDAAYTAILSDYKQFFNSYGVEPLVSFNDEPGADISKRRVANHLNRLAQQVGLETWVTYYRSCEEPLAGYRLILDDPTASVMSTPPSWATEDERLIAYYDFEGDALDKSGNSHHGTVHGAHFIEGKIVFEGDGDHVEVQDSEALEGMDALTVSLWFNQEEAENQGILAKGSVWGAYSVRTRSEKVLFFMRNSTLDFVPSVENPRALNRWQYFAATYNGTHCENYINGYHYATQVCPQGTVSTYYGNLYMSWYNIGDHYEYFNGSLDELMLFNRSLSEQEVVDVFSSTLEYEIVDKTINLTLTFEQSEEVPDTLTFSLYDQIPSSGLLETVKHVYVNGQEIWQQTTTENEYDIYTLDIGSFLQPGQNEVMFTFFANVSWFETLTLYFVEDFWRNRLWDITSNSPYWNYEHEPDPNGDLGPMDPYLDLRVHSMRHITNDNIDLTRASGDGFAYYTTYPATQPVIFNNRFLNGIYASALNVSGVWVYAYGDWGDQPYDDMDIGYRARIGIDNGLRGQNRYQLALPSWDSRMYDTLVFESLREGIEDSMIIATLKKAIQENPGAEAQQAQAYLNSLFSRPSREYLVSYFYNSKVYPIEKYADRSGEMLYDVAGDSEAFDFLDGVRYNMIHYILSLSDNETEPVEPFCGDAVCEGEETCETCPADCGECPPPPDCEGDETRPCGTDVGVCEFGTQTCSDGTWGSCAGGVGPAIETCNQEDDDCDGTVDNVDGGDSVEAAACQCYGGNAPNATEVCNGIDDDCDGEVDGITRQCGPSQEQVNAPQGICAFGTSVCAEGEWGVCVDAVYAAEGDECGDGMDNDCDGEVDESCATCTDGVQNGDEEGVDCGGSCPNACFGFTEEFPLDHFIMFILVVGGVLGAVATIVKMTRGGKESWEGIAGKYREEPYQGNV